MTEFIHTKNSVFEIDRDESLFRRVWSQNSVFETGEVWFPFTEAEIIGYHTGQVLRIIGPGGIAILTSFILS